MKNLEVTLDFSIELATKIKSGEVVGSFITNDGNNAEFVYISKSETDEYPFLFVKESNIGVAMWVNKGGEDVHGAYVRMKCDVRQAFKDGDVLVANDGNPFLYNGVIDEENENIGCHCGISETGSLQINISNARMQRDWANIRGVNFATEYKRGILVEKLRLVDSDKALEILKTYFKDEESKDARNLKPFDRVLVKSFDQTEWNISLFHKIEKDGEDTVYRCLDGGVWDQCIPYEGNEYLLNR